MNLYLVGVIVLLAAAAVIYRCLHRRPDDTPGSITRTLITGALLYGVIGPPVGLLVVTLTMSIPQLMRDLEGLQVAYLVGGLPAVMCGVTAGALKPARSSSSWSAESTWPAFALACAAGAVYGFALVLAIVNSDSLRFAGEALRAGAAPGLAAAAVCTLLFHGRPWMAHKPRPT
ncbi:MULTISPECIES: hypothetical protein [Achromobacter]|uniref:Uncharacterized protein n=1 Tax=Achromobacter kerstersii TaxID=1353890 RepID=A0A6S6Z2Z1_9BURK|nr:hypothetical protein [Achromobacter kerstersii]CAB3657902.1 hypothetical protein LMG3441_00399 [Achromobacter kerstersii]